MLLHRRKSAVPRLDYPRIREVGKWVEPTRVLILTDRSGTRRLRVEMLASDVTAEAMDALTTLLDVIETASPIVPACEPGCASGVALLLVPSPPG